MYNVETARHCLRLIRDIADRGVASSDPDNVGYALGELREVFLETASFENRLFEPAPANKIVDMESLLIELQWFDHFSKRKKCAEEARRPSQQPLPGREERRARRPDNGDDGNG